MRFLARLFLVLAVSLGLALSTVAREEIRAFASDATLNVDGSVRVVETIDVRAEGNAIRRGIYRDIPTVLLGPSGNKIRVGFDVESVTRAGRPEDFRVERMGNFQRIWIGSADRYVSVGEHRYVITYTMERMARSFDDHDELYWNATGNYWDFPILKSSAKVTLPDGAVISDLAAYTGEVGSTEKAVTISRTSDRQATFRTQRALGPGEGMSFAVSFQKGIIAYPEGVDALVQSASDLREVWLPVLAVLLVLVYNLVAWARVGRDPPKGTIIPLFHPPKDFSPALTHYVHHWGFAGGGWNAMTAAIFNLGVRGLVKIEAVDKKLTITRTVNAPRDPLPVGEQVVYGYIDDKGSVLIDKDAGPDLAAKKTEFTKAIESENRRVWFNHNTGYVIGSFALALMLIGAMVVLDVLEPIWLFAAFIGSILVGIVGSVVFSAMRQGGMRLLMIVVWGGILTFNVGGGILEMFSDVTINNAAIATGSLMLISLVFARLMRAPTIQGRKVMDEIDGFKMYLETAEKNRLNISNEPPMSIDRFERILPYAIALGVEKPWTEHFEAELSRNAVSDASGSSYEPNWYSGRGMTSSSLTQSISAVSTGMAAAMIAAQPVEASSSGSSGGGGGFSGGGGGGGGGGGW